MSKVLAFRKPRNVGKSERKYQTLLESEEFCSQKLRKEGMHETDLIYFAF